MTCFGDSIQQGPICVLAGKLLLATYGVIEQPRQPPLYMGWDRVRAGIPFTWNSIPLPADEQRWGGGGVPTIRWPWGEDWYYFWDQGPRPAWQLLGLMVSLKLSAEMRDEVLRFLNKVLEIQCLVRLLARCAVSRCLFVRSLILILLAVAHCFGLRSESDDHGLPAVSKSSRRGALALA